MGALDSCKSYQDYLNKIFEYLRPSSDYDLECYGYLCCFKDNEQLKERVIRVFQAIDSIKGESNNQRNLMLSRKGYFLAVGLLFKEFEQETSKLTAEEVAILARGIYSDEDTFNRNIDKEMIKIFTDKRLLKEVIKLNEATKKYSITEEANILFMIKQHYLKGKVDVNNDTSREVFINEMITKMQDGSLGDGVPDLLSTYQNELYDNKIGVGL